MFFETSGFTLFSLVGARSQPLGIAGGDALRQLIGIQFEVMLIIT